MNWTSMDAFWAMGGYGFYVWMSFGVGFAIMLAEVLELRAAARRQKADLRREFARSASTAQGGLQ